MSPFLCEGLGAAGTGSRYPLRGVGPGEVVTTGTQGSQGTARAASWGQEVIFTVDTDLQRALLPGASG